MIEQDTTTGGLNLPDGVTENITPKGKVKRMAIDKNVGGGVDRSKLSKGDFVFPEDAPDGGFPVDIPKDVADAVNSWGRYKGSRSFSEFKSRLTALAKRKGASFVSRLPETWTTATQEIEAGITATLTLEQEYAPEILQEASAENDNIMKVRMPFYVGGSVNKPAGFRKKLYFPTETLPGLVEEGNRQINEGQQPLTVYGRHKHALSGEDLPIGAVRELQQEGRVGYAIVDIAPTHPHGTNAQMLIKNKMVNAGSLRMEAGRYQLGRGKLNGEEVLVLEKGSKLDGIDLAPDSPAQPTYGITVLNEKVRVEPLSAKTDRRRKLSDDQITLEDVPADVKEAIERPLRAQVEAITQERDALKEDRDLRERDDYLRGIASKTTDPEAGFSTLVDLCNERKAMSKDTASTAVTPFLLQALEDAKATSTQEPKKTKEELVRELFVSRTAGGSSVTQDTTSTASEETSITQEEREYSGTISGLLVPMED